ncbi:MAG: GtrA family protein [Candidatus Microsaccharimonas sp.]
MHELIKKHAEKIRFGIVGGANTALDFLLLFILVGFGLDKIPANYISTSVALMFSFFVNRSFTFKNKAGSAKKQLLQLALFIGITLVGLWVIQPLIILGIGSLLASTGWSESLILLIAKLIATVASLIWNYVFYSRLVFKKFKDTEV